MSRWIRGIYNAAANFNMSRSLRAAAGRTLDRNDKQLHTSSDQRNQHVESSQSGESDQSGKYGGACHRNRDTKCGARDHCYANNCGHAKNRSSATDDPIEREYLDYLDATRSAKGKDTGSGIRAGYEFGDSQRSSNATRTNVEYTTGIPTGTTI
jgi:hypothetical protein